jgi:acetyltransferase
LPGHRAVLLEHEVKAWLHSHGLPTSREVLVQTSAQAAEAASGLGSPVVLKAQATGVIHKSALGLVALGVSPEHVETTFKELWSRSIEATGALPDGVLVQEMVPAGVELIVGTISDPDFGPLVMVGAGGSAVEMLGDRAFRLAPIDADQAMNVIVGLRIYQAVANAGRSDDFEWTALAQLVAYVSTLAWEYRDELAGLELNPVVMLPQRRGIVVVDASGERRGTLDDQV